MKPVLDAIFHGTLDMRETDPISQEKLYQLETYFDQVDSIMGKDFGQQMRDAEFELSEKSAFLISSVVFNWPYSYYWVSRGAGRCSIGGKCCVNISVCQWWNQWTESSGLCDDAGRGPLVLFLRLFQKSQTPAG